VKLKSYFAKNVTAALERARLELGPEAMLVHSRTAPPETRHLGECEVVMALAPLGATAGASPGSGAGSASAPPAQEDFRPLAAEMQDIRRQMERMAAAVGRSNVLIAARSLPHPRMAQMFASLVESGVDPELAHDMLDRLRAAGAEAEMLEGALAAEIAGRVACDGQLGSEGQRPRIVALVGPCGGGKTSTLVKLAVQYGLAARRPTQFLSVDTYRIAAADQLRSYAAILGVGFQALETPGALAQAIEEHRHKDLILIDTPGHGLNDLADAADLARFLASRSDIDTHLVLTASMKSADLSRVVDRFEVFRPQKLLFAKLDETEAFGPILNEAARTGKPLSFLSAGQRIPEDLEPATKDRIVNLVLGRAPRRAVATAA
jgi:flagellar biosynthesis protein FlhF